MNSQFIGFMQGRLSPIRNGRIQSFPWETWEEEFETASRIQIRKMEWTIDSENFASNPLLTSAGNKKIKSLMSLVNLEIPSVTCDYFMENPPWKTDPEDLFRGIESILAGMSEIGAKILVIPLVDNSSLGASVKTSAGRSGRSSCGCDTGLRATNTARRAPVATLTGAGGGSAATPV